MLGQNTICWHSRGQRVTATSTVEAEYLALSAAAKQLQWLQLALSDLRIPHDHVNGCDNVPTLYGDNNAMTEAMMPISTDALHYRTLLFELNEPVIMSIDKFDEVRIDYFYIWRNS